MNTLYLDVGLRLLLAVLAGGMVGMERSYHGRPAGFRTHTLVCMASALLMLVTAFEGYWFASGGSGRVTIDPTRMAQGIMTGIGFLGAGVIMKEGYSVRGLTTAASIWITAAIGIMIGIGFYWPAIAGTILTLGTLSIFRRIESLMPSESYAHLEVRFPRASAMPENDLRKLIGDHGFTIANLHYQLTDGGRHFQYSMMVRTRGEQRLRDLVATLGRLDDVVEFRLSPTGD